MSVEIVLNGTKLWEGTTVETIWDQPGSKDQVETWVVTPPGGSARFLGPADELILDGYVITGPHAGWKFETRQVGLGSGVTKTISSLRDQIPGRQLPSGLLRDVYYKGGHGAKCEKTEDGWICRHPCTVVDVPSIPEYRVTLESLIEVVPEFARKGFRVHWTLSRYSYRYRFTNGRAYLPADEVISREVWFKGQTWTKWGARRQIKKVEDRERDRLV